MSRSSSGGCCDGTKLWRTEITTERIREGQTLLIVVINVRKLCRTIELTRGSAEAAVELVSMGNFNRHDQLWRRGEIQLERQGESDPTIDLMNEYCLTSLLRRGTKTWSDGENIMTIDLVLASGS